MYIKFLERYYMTQTRNLILGTGMLLATAPVFAKTFSVDKFNNEKTKCGVVYKYVDKTSLPQNDFKKLGNNEEFMQYLKNSPATMAAECQVNMVHNPNSDILEFITNFNKRAREKHMLEVAKYSEKKSSEAKEVKEENKAEEAVEEEVDDGKITFKKIGGQDEAIDALTKSIVLPVKYPKAFQNGAIKRGFILYGPPGTGKSLLAEALANEANAHFIKVNASKCNSEYFGGTEKNWQKIFDEAKMHQPCIIFIDEFDSIAKQRGGFFETSYNLGILDNILQLMSDVEKNKDQIYFVGATNISLEMLDNAVTRPGRFGVHIEVKAPQTVEDVRRIFDIHTKKLPLGENIDKDAICKALLSVKATGADIAYMANDAEEAAKARCGIFSKMLNGTYKDEDLKIVRIEQSDFDTAIQNLTKSKTNRTDRTVIKGFSV